MRLFKLIVGIVGVSLILTNGFSQSVSDCEQKLSQAADEFNAGRFFGIAAILKPCLDDGFSKEQRQRANLLLTQTYLLLDDPIGAENSYIELLWANPEFEADTTRDPIDLVYLSKKFTADPIFSIFFKTGLNFSPVRVIHTVNPSGEANLNNNYSLRPGLQFGAGIDWHITPDIAVMGEFNYVSTAYFKKQVKFSGDELEFTDKQIWLTIPLSVKYTHQRGKLKPFAFAGFALHWLLSDKGQIYSLKTALIENQPVAIPAESPTLTLTRYRNNFNRSFLIGGGLRYKIGLNYIFGEMRYNFGLKNVVVSTSTFDYTGPMVEWGHADDYFRMDNFLVSAGFIRPLFKPRKLKHARTKSVLRGINKRSK